MSEHHLIAAALSIVQYNDLLQLTANNVLKFDGVRRKFSYTFWQLVIGHLVFVHFPAEDLLVAVHARDVQAFGYEANMYSFMSRNKCTRVFKRKALVYVMQYKKLRVF